MASQVGNRGRLRVVTYRTDRSSQEGEGGMRILIADDHRLIVEGVKLKLAELGEDTEFVVAMTVEDIQRVIRDHPDLDLALVDLAMPGANGRRHLTDLLE